MGMAKKCKCRFLVPVADNDGNEFPPELMLKIRMALDRQFGGCRFNSPSKGSWKGQVEYVHEVEVAVLEKRIPALRSLVLEIGKDLGQKAMYFEAGPPTIEIINVETGETDDDEDDPDDTNDAKESGKPNK
jgi:hypothetical protein